jgi:hypothetical protein
VRILVALVSTSIDDLAEMSAKACSVLRSSAVLLRTTGLVEDAKLNELAASALEYTVAMLTVAPTDVTLPRSSFLASLRTPGHVPTMQTVAWMVRRLILGRGAALRILPCAEISCRGPEILGLKAWIESVDGGPSGRSGEWPTTG